MTLVGEQQVVAFVLVLCRVGACLSLAPGFSSPRIAMRIRLSVALGLSLAIVPLVADLLRPEQDVASLATHLARECLIGAVLGLIARFVMAALETMTVAIAMSIGVTSSFATRIDENEQLPELSTLIVFAATAFMFLTDVHWILVRSLVDSYAVTPIGSPLDGGAALSRLVATLGFAFPLALQIASPFIVFGLLSNLAFALINKIAPQIAMYFISVPFIMLGGFALLYATSKALFSLFGAGFAFWLSRG